MVLQSVDAREHFGTNCIQVILLLCSMLATLLHILFGVLMGSVYSASIGDAAGLPILEVEHILVDHAAWTRAKIV